MSKQSLNEQEFIDKAYSALASGNGLELSTLMNEDSTELVSKASADDEEDPAAPVDEVDETASKTEQDAKDGDSATKGTEGGEKKEEPKKDASPVDPYAWVANLPDELKETVTNQLAGLSSSNARLEQYYKSNEGRTSALQKKINVLERELETRKTQQPPPHKAAAPSDLKLEDDETLAQLKEDDPALYKVLKQREEKTLQEAKKLVEQAKAEFTSTLEKQIAPLHQSQEDAYIKQEQAKVLAVVTNADQVVASKEWKIFEDTAPPGVKSLINSDNAEDVILAFQVYAGWLQSTGVVPPQQQQAAVASTPKAPVDTSAADKIEAERQRKLKAGAVGSAHKSTQQSGELDQDRLLQKFFEEISEKEGYTRKLNRK